MIDQNKLITKWKKAFAKAKNLTTLVNLKNTLHNSDLKPLLQKIKTATKLSEKSSLGKLYQSLDIQLTDLLTSYKKTFETNNQVSQKPPLDVMLPATEFTNGSNNALYQVIDNLVEYFKSFLFTINFDSELTSISDCFDLLNIPKDHPSRNESDSFYIDKTSLLRTHCTATTLKAVRTSKKTNNPDIRVVSLGAVFRNDSDDATHSHQFTQLDFMWIKKGLSLANLKWFINNMITHFFGENTFTRFRLSHFPFTEPSFEIDIRCWLCQNGCSICKQTKWIEILGAGIIHPQVMNNMGIGDTENITGIAAGIGIERLAMLKYGIDDIRDFYDNNFKFLTQFTD
ncbi:phenylalanine--tRNA ligase subunit alpha [Mycoplasmoides genitalium]